jgi:hypothetical protein
MYTYCGSLHIWLGFVMYVVNYIMHGVTFIHVTYIGNLNFYSVMRSPHGANCLQTVSDTEEIVSIYLETQN